MNESEDKVNSQSNPHLACPSLNVIFHRVNTSAEKVLEWHRFIELAQNEAGTEPGKLQLGELLESSAWAPDIQTARIMQQETLEVTPLLDRDALWGPLTDLSDPTETLDRLARGAVLEIAE